MSQENLNVIPDNPKTDYNNIEKIVATPGIRIGAHLLDSIFNAVFYLPALIFIFPRLMEIMRDFMQHYREYGDNFRFDFRPGLPALFYSLLVAVVAYFVIPVLTKGRTLGQLICNLRTVSVHGEPASLSQLLLRSLIYLATPVLNIVPMWFFMMSFRSVIGIIWLISIILLFTDKYHQALHDKWSDTVVVFEDMYRRDFNGQKGSLK